MPVTTSAAELRAAARRGEWRGTTAGHCPAYQQVNLAILPKDMAAEFAAFCTRNPKPSDHRDHPTGRSGARSFSRRGRPPH